MDGLAVLGVGREAGADEDDFHIFKRQTTEMDRGEKREQQQKRLLRNGADTQTSIVKSVGNESKPTKKVVYF